jgi:hypothetical protein
MLEGLSRFLVQHERCGAGFDVAHPAGLGSGRVSITCRGCGARHEYATATIEVERELIIEPAKPAEPAPEPQPPAAEPPAIPPRPAPYPESRRPAPVPPAGEESAPARRPRPRREVDLTRASTEPSSPPAAPGRGTATATPPRAGAPPGGILRSPRTTVALLVVTVAAVGFALLRLVNDDGGESSNPVAQPSPPASAPAKPAPSGSGGLPTPAEPPTTTLRTERFSVQTPPAWTSQTAEGGLLLEPPGGERVNVQIFFERSPGLSASQMAHDTADFLRREVPGASLYPRRIEIAGAAANELTARGPGETAIAVNVLRGPYRYLIVRRIFAGAKPHASLDAGRIVRSFRPV